MKTTLEFLDEAKTRLGIARDTELALALGVTKSQVSMFRSGTNFLGDTTARRIAEILEIDPAYVLACANAERASDPQIRGVWVRVAEAFATIALGIGLTAPSPQANAESVQQLNNNIHYTKYRRRHLLAA